MFNRWLAVAGLSIISVLELNATQSALAQATMESIEIETGWGGLGKPQHAVVAIRNEKGVYQRDGDRVDPALVEALIRALRAPPIVRPQMDNLGVTAAWLDAHLSAVEKTVQGQITDALPSQVRLFEDSFRNPKAMAGALATGSVIGAATIIRTPGCRQY